MQDVPEIDLNTLAERYSVLLFDAYGVLIHATGAYPGAAERLRQLNQSRKPYYILTNDASRLPETAAERYRALGLPVDARQVICAGSLLTPYFAEHGLTGSRCAVLGPADSLRYVEQAGGRSVPLGQDFDVLVVADESGYPFLESIDRVLTTLYRKLDRGNAPHLLLPNPDLVYPKGAEGFGIASGSLAGMLEAALGLRYPGSAQSLRFVRLGKPATGLFAEAERRSGTRDMVMVGDQAETDIRGARAFGIASALITDGVGGPVENALQSEIVPDFRLTRSAFQSP